MNSDSALILVSICFCVTAAGILYAFLRRSRHIARIYNWINMEFAALEEFRHRRELLEEHTSNYMNSLGQEGIHSLYESHTLLAHVEDMLLDVNNYLAAGYLSEATAFHRYIRTKSAYLLRKSGSLQKYGDLVDWKKKIENHIQTIGKHLAEASEEYASLGLIKRRNRKATSMSLREARIRLLRESLSESETT